MASRRRAARRGAALTVAGVSKNSRRPASLALTAVVAAVCASGAEPAATAQPSQGWELAWVDEFDGDALDAAKWNVQIGDGSALGIPGWGNNELQSYEAGNVSVAGGHLIITALAKAGGGRRYTSARINTVADAFPGEMRVDYMRVYRCAVDGATGLGCAGLAAPTDPRVRPTAPEDVYEAEYALYADAVDPLVLADAKRSRDGETSPGEETTVPLRIIRVDGAGGALALAEVQDAGARGTVVELATAGGGFAIGAADASRLRLFGMAPMEDASLAGEIQFDLRVLADATDPASTLQVKLDSGAAEAGIAELPIADLPWNEWTTVTVQIGDMVRNAGAAGAVDLGRVRNLFVLEAVGAVHLRVDAVRIRCGHKQRHGCGIAPS